MIVKLLPVLCLIDLCFGKVYFHEEFSDADWRKRWVQSRLKPKMGEMGRFVWTAGKFYGDPEKDKGIQTSTDYRFYDISAKFEDNAFTNEGRTLVVQFTVKHEQSIDCGGGYIKLFDCGLDQQYLNSDSKYKIMFGPDICGNGNKRVHVIFNYNGQNLERNNDIDAIDDPYTHLYRLVVKPDNTYKVLIDGKLKHHGLLEDDWKFLLPKKIKDPNAQKPSDWVDQAKIDDPTDAKPDDWDVPEYVEDTEAKKPADWDDEMDGTWERPQIKNVAFKGEWKPKQIDNPAYKGVWEPPEVDNPKYIPDPNLYMRGEICAVGIDIWQVKAGTIFDNIMITDREEEAVAAQKEILKRMKKEKIMKEKLDMTLEKPSEAEAKIEDIVEEVEAEKEELREQVHQEL